VCACVCVRACVCACVCVCVCLHQSTDRVYSGSAFGRQRTHHAILSPGPLMRQTFRSTSAWVLVRVLSATRVAGESGFPLRRVCCVLFCCTATKTLVITLFINIQRCACSLLGLYQNQGLSEIDFHFRNLVNQARVCIVVARNSSAMLEAAAPAAPKSNLLNIRLTVWARRDGARCLNPRQSRIHSKCLDICEAVGCACVFDWRPWMSARGCECEWARLGV
jgi:hypothetical protein